VSLYPSRRAHARTALALFVGLGAQVGAFAVLIPDLAASRGLTPAALGAALAVEAATSIVVLVLAGRAADRWGRRGLLVLGLGAFAVVFTLLAAVEAAVALWPTMALYGIANGCLDLGANTVGSDYEHAHRVRAMVRLHAGFSGAAAAFALIAAVLASAFGHRTAYAVLAAGFVVLALALTRAPLPPHERVEPGPRDGAFRLLAVPGIALATVLCALCFFGDGALQSYSALFLRGVQAAGVVTAGVALAAFHSASLVGRLVSARVIDRIGERRTLCAAGAVSAAAMTVVVAAGSPAVVAAALLVIGFSQSPIVPTLLSIAARTVPERRAQAVSVVTSVGYSAFVLAPPVVGGVAQATSLRAALALVIASSAAIALLAFSRPRLA
jgi:predicted MFS family arabinose efflux permease